MRRNACLPRLPSPLAAAAGLALLLGGCASTRVAAPVAAPADQAAGLERVIGRDARALVALFGDPDQDQIEGVARRLQFAGPACVLDAYLYAPKEGREPIVTHIDARLPNGDDIDRASCVAALGRRR